ncbi:sel1 repeat family protein [Helicobacter saguini]|uniref:beta-lactamase n=1 Tax=Helicobacter saguini TaxID=1548018 RepID=A0A347VQ71_9HELI|nr:sel1 repeat family protein [Helicobacter saguini]MWV61052.1 sel1 repeat family protein [Helicobacter saguini]MWV68279.1 sel1 repeat family protein [Helicobacter saguini]MWV70256.1 sel1 repeat family protein [Helicobacter saguini]MWV72159.1 sel1 repeat family protein [Helicobacter saguini]TLD95220.1 sel1 repeat family protein [Helicobacter saguini]
MKKLVICALVACSVAFAAENLDEANKAYNEGNYTKAIELYKGLCDAKEAKACAALGLMYRNAKGVSEDSTLSKQYYQKACDAGDNESCNVVNW